MITNAAFPKSSLCKIAGMCHTTAMRGRSVLFIPLPTETASTLCLWGDVKADQDMVGTLGAQVMAEAILRVCGDAESAYGLVGAMDL